MKLPAFHFTPIKHYNDVIILICQLHKQYQQHIYVHNCLLMSLARSLSISAYTMVAISIDKYLAIMYPMRLRMPKIQAKIIILVIWSAALITSLPTALLSSLTAAPQESLPPTQSSFAPSINNSTTTTTTTNITTNRYNGESTSASDKGTTAMDYSNRSDLEQASQSSNQERTNSLIQSNSIMSNGTITINNSSLLIANATSAHSNSGPATETPNMVRQLKEQYQEQKKYFCQESWTFWPPGKYYYSMALMILQFVLPLFVLVITYTRIVIVVWGKRMPGEEDNARDARMARSKRKVNRMPPPLSTITTLTRPYIVRSQHIDTHQNCLWSPYVSESNDSICL